MLDWFWRTLGYELEKDVIKAWALNRMKEEKIEEKSDKVGFFKKCFGVLFGRRGSNKS